MILRSVGISSYSTIGKKLNWNVKAKKIIGISLTTSISSNELTSVRISRFSKFSWFTDLNTSYKVIKIKLRIERIEKALAIVKNLVDLVNKNGYTSTLPIVIINHLEVKKLPYSISISNPNWSNLTNEASKMIRYPMQIPKLLKKIEKSVNADPLGPKVYLDNDL